jgi:hypothetical protein
MLWWRHGGLGSNAGFIVGVSVYVIFKFDRLSSKAPSTIKNVTEAFSEIYMFFRI